MCPGNEKRHGQWSQEMISHHWGQTKAQQPYLFITATNKRLHAHLSKKRLPASMKKELNVIKTNK